jgi:hypothetical protein
MRGIAFYVYLIKWNQTYIDRKSDAETYVLTGWNCLPRRNFKKAYTLTLDNYLC